MTSLPANPIYLLSGLASDFRATVISQSALELRFSLPVPMTDGRTPTYEILASGNTKMVSAKEAAPLRLPTFCPERHINFDATFCMNWKDGDSLDVVDQESAEHWWATLVQFLRLQERVNRLRRWPPSAKQWAHGDAAQFQKKARIAAEDLGPDFLKDLEEGRLRVINRKIGGHSILRVLRRNVWIYSVRLDTKRVINLRKKCVCPSGRERRPRVLRSCGDHAKAASDLAIAIQEQTRAEETFWESMKGRPCCGTMENCPLK